MYAEFGDAEVKKPVATMFVLGELVSAGYGQDTRAANTPFTLSWSKGKCLRCRIAAGLEEIQFFSRSEVWDVGSNAGLNMVNTIVVHSTDAGRTWREVPQTGQMTDPGGRLAFPFLDVAHGWIVPANPVGDPETISSRDGGQHWQSLSQRFLQSMQFIGELPARLRNLACL